MSAQRLRYLFLNLGHFADHMFMLIFAKAAVSAGLAFGLAEHGAYAEMIPYGIPALVLFGACAPLAAFMADKWTRNGMITVFFVGIGASSVATGFAQSPLQIGIGLSVIAIFAAIYHPVGIAMVIEGGGRVGWRIGVNGVWGNMGVAAAPLITGFILAAYDWRLAFILPGLVSIAVGIGYGFFARSGKAKPPPSTAREKALIGFAPGWKRALCALALVSSAGGFVFGALIFIIPRLFEVRMTGVSVDIAVTGALAACVYAVAAFSQLIVGRLVDRHPVKPILFVVAVCQVVLVFFMSMQTDYMLFAAALLAMAFVFGQIPITDAVLSRYVPDVWRAKVLSVKFLLNLGVGALSLITARTILADGGGFETVVLVLAIGACFIVLGAMLLPAKTDPAATPATAPAE
ncbi:MAG: MFS transporter [Rhodospirillaceae bacterium]|nr:MFS transporter [Rhodospirillaceae bacterium]MDD9924941.1 MFS transporter [Rhodospirillaceae bacterium]